MNTGMAKTLVLVFALVLMTVISTEGEAQKGASKIGLVRCLFPSM